jgi:hypothetical protein
MAVDTVRAKGAPMRQAWLTCVAALLAGSAVAQEPAKPVYRCPGPPVLYTDTLSAQEAKDRGCRTIEGAPITVFQVPRRALPAQVPSTGASGPAVRSGESRVEPSAQKARDSDARRILESELKREEEALDGLKRDFNNGEPERRGDERNYAKYQERVAEMRAAISRKEADIAALKRELAKLTP